MTKLVNETHHNDTVQRNDTKHNDTQHKNTQHNESQHNDTQHSNKIMRQSASHVNKQTVVYIRRVFNHYAECHYAACRGALVYQFTNL